MNPKLVTAIGGLIIIIIGGVFLFGGDNDVSENGGATETEETKRLVPTFSLPDYDGTTVHSTDFGNKLLVVNAWASWCPFCVDELPDFVQLQQAFPDEIAVIAINRAEPLRIARDFTDSIGLSDDLVFLMDSSDSFYKSIGGFSMPETLFITPTGEIALHKRGPFKFPEMKQIVEGILANN